LDTILSGLRLVGAGISLAAVIPMASVAIEVALAGVIIVQLRNVFQRKALVSALFADENADY
jgi:hypothetical protein